MPSRPLVVAIIASVALVALLAADASMNRTLALDQRVGDGWRTVAAEPMTHDRPFVAAPDSVAANETLTFRLRVENGHPWSYSESYRVYANGLEVASGTLEAPARGDGESTFNVRAAAAGAAERGPPGGAGYLELQVRIDDQYLYAGLEVRQE